jgi:putative flippase GtrA
MRATSGPRRWGVFSLVGLGGFALQIAAIAALTRLAAWPPALATLAGVEAAILLNFAGHCRWTWADRPVTSRGDRGRRLLRYQVTQSSTLAANFLLTSILVGWALPIEIANTLAVGVLSVANYALASTLVFRPPMPHADPTPRG